MKSCRRFAVRFQLVAVGTGLAILGAMPGCGPPKNVAITTKPSSEELPQLAPVEHVTEVTVAVEGGPTETGFRLVPEFKEPELTAAEKAALGPEKVHFKFLPYNELSLPPNSTVGPWRGGISTAIDGTSRIVGRLGKQPPLAGVAGWGGATTAVDPFATYIARRYHSRETTASVGPRSAVTVGTDPGPSRIAEREPHKTP
jgi:hypothetical protein